MSRQKKRKELRRQDRYSRSLKKWYDSKPPWYRFLKRLKWKRSRPVAEGYKGFSEVKIR